MQTDIGLEVTIINTKAFSNKVGSCQRRGPLCAVNHHFVYRISLAITKID